MSSFASCATFALAAAAARSCSVIGGALWNARDSRKPATIAPAMIRAPAITLVFMPARSDGLVCAPAGERLAEHGGEFGGFHVPDDAERAPFLPGRIVERDRRRAEDPEMLEQ